MSAVYAHHHETGQPVLPEDVQPWPDDTTPPAGVHWSDPPPPGWAAMFQVLLLPDRRDWEYVLHDIDAIVATFGTRAGHAMLITSQRTPLNDQEQATVAALRAAARGGVSRGHGSSS
jgi:hypothetical protein